MNPIKKRIRSNWSWCELISTDKQYYYYKTPLSHQIIRVDKVTGVGYNMNTNTTGSWFTFKRTEYDIKDRSVASIKTNPKQRRLF